MLSRGFFLVLFCFNFVFGSASIRYVCALHVCLIPEKARRGPSLYRWLESKLGSSARLANALTY